MDTPQQDITRLINEWQRGDKHAEGALFDLLYTRLHQIAAFCLRNDPKCRTLNATGLIHEAYLRFQKSKQMEFADRGHFLRLAARVMHNIVVDQARARRSDKRGGNQIHVDVGDVILAEDRNADQILIVDQALHELKKRSPRLSYLMELRFFAGFNREESAAVLGLSERQITRDWDIAFARLTDILHGRAPGK